jgi:isoquinoline 1-oxidoreductase beta subunit
MTILKGPTDPESLATTYSTATLVAALDVAAKTEGVAAVTLGDFEKAMAGAAKTVEARYEDPLRARATMEPMACTVKIGEDGGDIWLGAQVITRVQAAAKSLNLPLDKVRVHD